MNTNNWIFLRGLTRGNIHWADFPSLFQNKHPEFQIELLEIPGNGTTCNEKTPINPQAAIEMIRKKSKFCQQGQTFNLCGISLGGMIAMKWAELYPNEVQTLTIINSSLKQLSPFYHLLKPNSYLSILHSLFTKDTLKQEATILQITSNHYETAKEKLPHFSDFTKNHPVTKSNFVKQLILANRIKLNEQLPIPLNILWSQQDRLVNCKCSENIAKKFNAKTFVHPSAGHDLPLDAPDWLCEILGNKQ